MIKTIKILVCLFAFNADAAVWTVSAMGSTNPCGNWKGLNAVDWSVINPGDTLELCGDDLFIRWLSPTTSGTPEQPITIDCKNKLIEPEPWSGGDRNAIGMTDVEGFVIQNCRISNAFSGVAIQRAKWITVQDCVITNSSGDGLSSKNSDWVTFQRNIVYKSGNDGIAMRGSGSHGRILNNVVSRARDVITLHENNNEGNRPLGYDFLIKGNNASYGSEEGYDITSGTNIQLIDNIGHHNNKSGIIYHTAGDVVIDSHRSWEEDHFYIASINAPNVEVRNSYFESGVRFSENLPQDSVHYVHNNVFCDGILTGSNNPNNGQRIAVNNVLGCTYE